MNKIQKFIEDNNLDFTGSDSELNSNCVALAGFICYEVSENMKPRPDAHDYINSLSISSDAKDELMRVFDYAWENSYEEWWKKPEAHDEYVFA